MDLRDLRFSLPYADRKLAIGSGAIAAAQTMGARCSQPGSTAMIPVVVVVRAGPSYTISVRASWG